MVEVRSNSRNSARISWDRETGSPQGAEPVPQEPFVFRGEKGEEQADGHGLRARRPDALRRALDLGFVQGGDDRAVRTHPARNAEAQLAGHDVRRAAVGQVVEPGPVLAADLDDVREPLVGHQGGGHPRAFQDGVGGHGGAVDHGQLGVRRGRAGEPLGHYAAHAREHGLGRVARRGQRLPGPGIRAVGPGEVGEGAAGIDADGEHVASSVGGEDTGIRPVLPGRGQERASHSSASALSVKAR